MKMSKFFGKISGKIKNLRLRQIIYFAVIIILILTIFGINLYRQHVTESLYDQREGQRWSNDVRCGQVSLFFSESYGINTDRISEFEYNINKGLIADGYQDASASKADGTAVWNDCYSAMGSISVTRDRRTVDAVGVGIGGDFFQFHPMQMVSGNYINSDSMMKDYVILDEELAWQLFGSNDIVGETITFEGVPHYIAGVVARDSGKYVKAAGLNFPTIYLSFESLATYGTIDASVLATNGSLGSVTEKKKDEDEDENRDSDVNTEATGIVCMEVVMPNPVENYAKNFLISKLGINTNVVEVVDNTARYENKNLTKVLQNFHIRGMQLKPVILPYWENNARAHENILAIFLLIQIICAIVIFIMLAIFVVQSYRHRKWRMGDLFQKFLDWKYDVESGVKKHNAKWKYF